MFVEDINPVFLEVWLFRIGVFPVRIKFRGEAVPVTGSIRATTGIRVVLIISTKGCESAPLKALELSELGMAMAHPPCSPRSGSFLTNLPVSVTEPIIPRTTVSHQKVVKPQLCLQCYARSDATQTEINGVNKAPR